MKTHSTSKRTRAYRPWRSTRFRSRYSLPALIRREYLDGFDDSPSTLDLLFMLPASGRRDVTDGRRG